jgi:BMFP domain-containing protein YqiC
MPKEYSNMNGPKIFEDISARISEMIANSPAKDVEKNLRALMTSSFNKLDLVTREEFDIQKEVLAHTRARLEELEHRVAQLEATRVVSEGD